MSAALSGLQVRATRLAALHKPAWRRLTSTASRTLGYLPGVRGALRRGREGTGLGRDGAAEPAHGGSPGGVINL
ncbi:hypothetical protein GCM10009539_09730 [Cryptosporangium japonicum]|uniref:Uncharacterized protein n=1 Tax=Cryptosporangium japonicum TaxID=80872 RepID=A0ABN0TNX7_9ACTN